MPVLRQEVLDLSAEATGFSRINRDPCHYFRKYSAVPAALNTEAIVLRSLRYGEADRILHLYTPGHGKLSAIAKGVRRTRSRFGARLEPFFRVRLMLHRGRSDLATVTGVDTLAAYARLRGDGRSLDSAARACDAVGRIFETTESHPAVYNLLCSELGLLDAEPAAATYANALAFRLKLLVVAGLAPQLNACASCGARDALLFFAPAAGGVACAECAGAGFALTAEAHQFLVRALAVPLAEAPAAPLGALRQADRAISEMLHHHAHLRLRPAAIAS